jgi:hypothetical protein
VGREGSCGRCFESCGNIYIFWVFSAFFFFFFFCPSSLPAPPLLLAHWVRDGWGPGACSATAAVAGSLLPPSSLSARTVTAAGVRLPCWCLFERPRGGNGEVTDQRFLSRHACAECTGFASSAQHAFRRNNNKTCPASNNVGASLLRVSGRPVCVVLMTPVAGRRPRPSVHVRAGVQTKRAEERKQNNTQSSELLLQSYTLYPPYYHRYSTRVL